MGIVIRRTAVALALSLALVACGGDDPDTTQPETSTDAEAGTEPDASAEDEAGDDASEESTGTEETSDSDEAADDSDDMTADGSATVAVAETDLGEILVDGAGRSLYLFDPDEQGPSQCTDDCADNWPPLVTDGEPTADGAVDTELLGTVERDDGSVQVTYDDWPLYHFAGDQEPGDVAGQAVQDVWWVLDADGTPIRDPEAAASGDGGVNY